MDNEIPVELQGLPCFLTVQYSFVVLIQQIQITCQYLDKNLESSCMRGLRSTWQVFRWCLTRCQDRVTWLAVSSPTEATPVAVAATALVVERSDGADVGSKATADELLEAQSSIGKCCDSTARPPRAANSSSTVVIGCAGSVLQKKIRADDRCQLGENPPTRLHSKKKT